MDPRDALARLFGFEDFRPGQEQAVAAGLADRDALVVMPTGSGKSLCYQLPALIREDLTLVVSPLVSLMQDQVQALDRIAPGKVELINAQRAGARNAEAVQRAVSGEVRVLYVSPERFATRGFLPAVSRARMGLFVVDEAHCVSQWGHDFRPDYFALAAAARSLQARATIALTATATPTVALDIARRLELRDPVHVRTGFDRTNLSFAVVPCATAADRRRRLIAALSEPGALPAIVYAGTRGNCEELAHALGPALGEEVLAYHAGLDRGLRHDRQERFMSGQARVIVATNAFGMGIDKADVRTVAHASVPGSLEAYYQEAGRAGRDGRPARALLFVEQRDKGLHVFFIQRSRLEDAAFQRVGERLAWAGMDGRYDLALAELAGLAGLSAAGADADGARAIIGHLSRAGIVAPEPSAPDRAVGRLVGAWDARALALCRSSARDAERVRWNQYRSVWDYVERTGCRREALLTHFGDRTRSTLDVPCCDV
ncbi:MAG: RecQ family ATP-dependent DNA helicase, partial [Actinomycetota bacterium]|nr:RecQ family ATP-dependent DNA helicase [Actinomycetota bacterium]